ncbi:LapA family protein [Ideonella dechloratans]|uniref:LapA family protein n=1 Tax=Ideonella dechloratans TaxID=36863 RepID=A0A643FC29_IDEDE|nr:LapA family protein [Ideonella dechloratans]KAB0583069.1 LapA family protein [Ideonella dechloratans]UFU11699.1 LapA family protein [Ideonella dechloratans]
MKTRTLALLIALFLLGLFCALNWQALSTPSALSLGLMEVQAPLGLILLGATVVISGLFLFYIVSQQAYLLMESRRFTKELQAQRQLADQAEASRFTELQTRLEALVAQLEQGRQGAEQRLQAKSDEAVRELSAHLAEMEDKLDRALARLG